MRKVNLFASKLILLAENCLRGQKARVRRVMAEWLKTPYFAVSRDQSSFRYWTLPGSLWVRSNKSHEGRIMRAKTLINNIEAELYRPHEDNEYETYKGEKYGF